MEICFIRRLGRYLNIRNRFNIRLSKPGTLLRYNRIHKYNIKKVIYLIRVVLFIGSKVLRNFYIEEFCFTTFAENVYQRYIMEIVIKI